jgi:hypothetical protein
MQTFFFDMKDGVPLRDRIGVEFDTNVEAIEHSPSISATRACVTTRTLRYPWSTHTDGKFIASSSTGKPAANKPAGAGGLEWGRGPSGSQPPIAGTRCRHCPRTMVGGSDQRGSAAKRLRVPLFSTES